MINDLFLLLMFLLFVAAAGLFAGAETGVYQLSRLRLRLSLEKRKWPHVILDKSLKDTPGLLVSLLLGTNLAHYFATSSITYMMLRQIENEHNAELLATVVSTPIFFVFSELIPKNLFYYRADNMMPVVSPAVFVFHKIACLSGIVWVLKKLSTLACRVKGTAMQRSSLAASREHFEEVLLDSHEERILSPVQTGMMWRLRSISRMAISSVMTALAKVEMVDVKSSKADLLAKLGTCRHSRYPVYDGLRTNILGFINIYDCLDLDKDFTSLHEFIKDIHKLNNGTTVLEAIQTMQRENEHIILVTRTGATKTSKPLGIVTMKDLAEELLGELGEW